jgi:hypothetical protein
MRLLGRRILVMQNENPMENRKRALDAVAVLNDLIGDLVTGTMSHRMFVKSFNDGKITEAQMVGIQKMCLSHLALALCKCKEFWERYHDLVVEEYRLEFTGLLKELSRRNVIDFRNRYAGHIWDKKKHRPLFNSEVMSYFDSFSADRSLYTFLDWLNKPNGNEFPSTVVSIVESLRDALQNKYSIQPEEIIIR